MTFQKGKFNIFSIFFCSVFSIIKRKRKSTEKKTKEKKANNELIKMFDDKIKLSIKKNYLLLKQHSSANLTLCLLVIHTYLNDCNYF